MSGCSILDAFHKTNGKIIISSITNTFLEKGIQLRTSFLPFDDSKKYQGAINVKIDEGWVYENVVSFDFKSLYPWLAVIFNVSPETFIKSSEVLEEYDESNVVCHSIDDENYPEIKYVYMKKEVGILPKVITEFMKAKDDADLILNIIKSIWEGKDIDDFVDNV